MLSRVDCRLCVIEWEGKRESSFHTQLDLVNRRLLRLIELKLSCVSFTSHVRHDIKVIEQSKCNSSIAIGLLDDGTSGVTLLKLHHQMEFIKSPLSTRRS